MQSELWIPLVISSLVAGSCLVGLLVLRRNLEPLAAILGLAALTVTGLSFAGLATTYPGVEAILLGLVLSTAGFGGGFALASALLDRLATKPETIALEVPSERTDGVTAILLACIEPEVYTPSETAAEINDLVGDELLKVSLGVLPFLFTAAKARYRSAGGRSPSRRQLREVAERLGGELESNGFDGVMYATCSGPNRLGAVVAQAVSEGCRRMVAVPLCVSPPPEMEAALREVDELRLDEHDIAFEVADTPVDTEAIAQLVASRVIAATQPDETGVVLVAQGLPDPIAQRHPVFEEAEMAFVNRVRSFLLDAGATPQRVRVAWSEWHEPDITTTVRHLAAVGARRILVVPACEPLESISTLLDLRLGGAMARVDKESSVISLPAWRGEPAVIDALVEVARAAARRIDRT